MKDIITSTSNQQIKNLTALIKKSKERKAQKVFVTEGPRMCFEAPVENVVSVFASESFARNVENAEKLEKYGDKLVLVSDSLLKSVSDTQTPQGIIAIVKQPRYRLEDIVKGEQTLVLLLESIQDPGNLGTMIRTAEGAGASGVLMNNTTVDIFNPKTIRSTMGSIYRVPFVISEDFQADIEALKAQGVRLYAAHLKGKMSYDQPDYRQATGFMIGNEGNGLSDSIADMADTYIRIPMEGQVESLNAAISATLLMYECNRQRRI